MSILATRLDALIAKSPIDSNEHRASIYGGLNMFTQQADAGGLITEELRAAALKSVGRELKVPVINHNAGLTISSDLPLIIADSENTSAQFLVQFAQYSFGFTQQPSAFSNNAIALQRDFEVKLQGYINALGAQLDTDAIAALTAAKSQVFKDSLDYAVVGNVLQVPFEKRAQALGDVATIMQANDHFGKLHILGNAGMTSVLNQLEKSGMYNAENKQLEYADKVLHFSNRLGNEAADYANLIAVQDGSLGILTRFEREVENGTTLANGTTWSKELLPGLNMPVGTYYYETAVDGSALAGAATADSTRVAKQHFGFGVEVAFMVPYNSDPTTIAEPIVKAAILKEV